MADQCTAISETTGQRCRLHAIPGEKFCFKHGGATLSGEVRSKCVATSKQTGKRCGSYPVPGATVCRMHGGNAPQVLKKAAERLQEARDKALASFVHYVDLGEVDPKTLLQAALGLTDKVELLEGRATQRGEVTVDDAAGAREKLAYLLARRSERSGTESDTGVPDRD